MEEEKSAPPASQPESPWQYRSNNKENAAAPAADAAFGTLPLSEPREVNWTASEFIAHSKGVGWFVSLGAITIALDFIIFLWTRDILSVVVILIMAVIVGVLAIRKPRVMNYTLNAAGLSIGQKFYPYSDFKSFALLQEGAFGTIMFLPLKRFMPSVSIYYEPKDEDRIMEVLSQYLPFEHQEHDMVDRVARRLRF